MMIVDKDNLNRHLYMKGYGQETLKCIVIWCDREDKQWIQRLQNECNHVEWYFEAASH